MRIRKCFTHLLLHKLKSSENQTLDKAGEKKEAAAAHVKNGLWRTSKDSWLVQQ